MRRNSLQYLRMHLKKVNLQSQVSILLYQNLNKELVDGVFLGLKMVKEEIQLNVILEMYLNVVLQELNFLVVMVKVPLVILY